MTRRVIATDEAPAAVASYSQGIEADGFVFCSGQVPIDPSTNELVSGPFEGQARRCLDNLTAVLSAAGTGWHRVVKVTVYLADIAHFAEFNKAYADYVGSEPPARAAFAVAALPMGAEVEVECIALAGDG